MKSLGFLTHQEIFNHAVQRLFGQAQASLLPRGGGAYRGYCGGCPVGSFIKPRDYMTAMEGVPVRYIAKPPENVSAYIDIGVAALKRALLRSRINVSDPLAVELLSCLQNVHDVFGPWEWCERLASIARQFGRLERDVQPPLMRYFRRAARLPKPTHTAPLSVPLLVSPKSRQALLAIPSLTIQANRNSNVH